MLLGSTEAINVFESHCGPPHACEALNWLFSLPDVVTDDLSNYLFSSCAFTVQAKALPCFHHTAELQKRSQTNASTVLSSWILNKHLPLDKQELKSVDVCCFALVRAFAAEFDFKLNFRRCLWKKINGLMYHFISFLCQGGQDGIRVRAILCTSDFPPHLTEKGSMAVFPSSGHPLNSLTEIMQQGTCKSSWIGALEDRLGHPWYTV